MVLSILKNVLQYGKNHIHVMYMQESQYKLEKKVERLKNDKKRNNRSLRYQDLLNNLCESIQGGSATERNEWRSETD